MVQHQILAELLALVQRERFFNVGEMLRNVFNREARHELNVFSLPMRFNEPLDFRFQILVGATLFLHVRRAIGGVKRDCTIEYATYFLPAFGLQAGALPVSWP